MPLIIRPAAADDQYAITAIVRAARLNPRDLDWQRFLLARWGQDIIGVGQVRPHRDGSRELASIAVVPEWQGNGVGRMLVQASSDRCREKGGRRLIVSTAAADIGNLRFYQRQGFRMYKVVQDAFTPQTGYAEGQLVGGIPLRDQVFLELEL